MKNPFLFLFGVALFTYCGANEKADTNRTEFVQARKEAKDTARAIEKIKHDFKDINDNIDKCKKVKKNRTGRSSEGGVIGGYFCNDTLKKIVVIDFGEIGKVVTEYYLKNGQLFFIFKEEQDYDQPVYEGKPKIANRFQSRFYIADSCLIRWLDNQKKEVDPKKNSYSEIIKQYFIDVDSFSQALRALNK